MADVKTNQAKLYKALQGVGFKDLGSEELFASKLQDSNNRKKLFNALQSQGFKDLGDYDSFEKRIYDGSNGSNGVNGSVESKSQQKPAKQTQPVTPAQQPTQKTQMPVGFGQLDINSVNPIGGGLGWDAPKKEETPIERAVKGQFTPEETQRAQKRQRQKLDEAIYEQETGNRMRQPVHTASWEAPTLARDENGNIQRDENGNPLLGMTTDQDVVKEHQYIVANQEEWDSLSDREKREREKNIMLQVEQDNYEEPGFLGVTANKLGAGFIKAGLGLLNGMQALASGMIVEDASSPTGYSKTAEYNPADDSSAINRGLTTANEYAERMSRRGEPRKGEGFVDMLMDGDIGGFLLKGWGTGLESAPMTLSAYNPYTMVLNAVSMAGNNFREQTLENPDIPTWKRASMAVGSAAIEQAVEKFADPVFKYIGGGKILKKASKEASEEITKKITEEAEKTIAKRIIDVLKDAAGEGLEEVVTNFGNDALGEALDLLSGDKDYGIRAQWEELKRNNPNASLSDFAYQKAKENLDSFFGGALAGAYMSGGAQVTVTGLQYAVGKTVSGQQIINNPREQVHPVTLDVAQSFDDGYTLESDEERGSASARYYELDERLGDLVGEGAMQRIDRNPTEALANIDQFGLDEEGQKLLNDYIAAKATYDGMVERIQDDHRRSRVNSYNVRGNVIEELDSEGNVVGTHEYDNADDLKLGLFELQQERANNDMLADIKLMRAMRDGRFEQMINDYCTMMDISIEDFEAILNKNPMERTEAEQQMVQPFSQTLHEKLYDNSTLHEEQNAEDGSDVADSMSIDLNEPDASQAEEITSAWNAAIVAREELFARNEDLAQEVMDREKEGMPHQGIISSLDSFSPQDVQVIIDYYNAQAKFDGFINRMSQNIDEEAANSRERHSFKGTVNGQADLSNVYTISDGVNEYFLVSGNVQTDADGKIIGSDSGLVIGMDADGSFVQLSDTSGYSVIPSVQTLDQFEEQERIRLQEQVSSVIDPNGALMGETGSDGSNGVNGVNGTNWSDGGSHVQSYLDQYGIIPLFNYGSMTGSLNLDGGVEAKRVAKKMLQMFKSAEDIQDLHERMVSSNIGATVNELTHIYNFFEAYKRGEISDKDVESLFDSNASKQRETSVPTTETTYNNGNLQENGTDNMIGRSLTEQEANDLISSMESNATVAPEVELTIENWDMLFGEDGKVDTPIGQVKMGENQFTKLMRQDRNGKLGMVKPTLESPDIIIEDDSEAKPGDISERQSSYVFVKSFKKEDGSRYYYFTSVTVSKDGKEVVISNQEKRRNAIAKLLSKGKLVWKHADDVSADSDVSEGLYSSQGNVSDPTTEGTDAPQTNNISAGKDTENIDNVQENQQKILEVTDKDGVKRYENGVPVDVAIEDILNDGLDVNETIDLAIGEAQQALDKIKTPKTRAEQVKNAQKRTELQNTIDYYTQMRELVNERTVADVVNREETINNQVEQPASVENVVPSQTSQTVEDKKLERIKELKAELGELFDDDFTKANDVYELVSMWVGRKRNLAWDDVNGKRGLQKELGWTRKIGGDTKYIETLLAKNGEGMGVDEFAHMVWESPENSVNGEKRWTDKEIKDALLELLQSAGSKSDVVDYAVNTRERQARAALEAERQRAEEEAMQEPDITPLTSDEIAEMEDNLPFAQSTDEDIPDAPITLLSKEVEALMQEEGTPEIKLVDTDRMTDGDWIDLAMQMYDGAFISQEDVERAKEEILSGGVWYNPENGVVTVYSDGQTPADIRYKVETIKDIINGRSNEREAEGLEAEVLQRPEEAANHGEETETPAAERTDEATGEGRTGGLDDWTNGADDSSVDMSEIKRIASGFSKETPEEFSSFERTVPKMSDAELLAYMQEDGHGDINNAHHMSLYDEYDYRHGNEQVQAYDDYLKYLHDSRTTFEEAKGMLDNLRGDKSRFATPQRSSLLGREEALEEYIDSFSSDPLEAIERNAALFREEQADNELYRDGDAATIVPLNGQKRTAKQKKALEKFAERQWRRAKQVAEDTVQKLGLTEKVTIVDNVDELDGSENFSNRKRRAKGWFDTDTGKIVIVFGNNLSPNDVFKTILHEGVAHYGLRELFGEHFDDFLDNVYDNASTEVWKAIDEDKYGGDTRKATEEYLASLAEETDFDRADTQRWWYKIKESFYQVLRNIGLQGFDYQLSDNDLRYILWRSYQNLANPGRYKNVFNPEADSAMRSKLGIDNQAEEAKTVGIENEIPKNVMNRKDEEAIRNRVKNMTLSEASEAYHRINENMRDENGLDLDEHFEKTKQDWISSNGLEGLGEVTAKDLQDALDKYGSGIVELRWELQDRIIELGGNVSELYRDGEDANSWYSEDLTDNEEKLNNKYKDENTHDLFLSLSEKEGEEYNGTVNEIAERVLSGRARIRREDTESGRRTRTKAQIGAEIISANRGGIPAANSVRAEFNEDAPSRARIEDAIEQWAKANGLWIDENAVKESSHEKNLLGAGEESRVYLSEDGNTVTKFNDPYQRVNGGLLKALRNIDVFNTLFPVAPYKVVGYTRDADGKFRVVTEQPFVDGVQYDFEDYLRGGAETKVVEMFNEMGMEPVEGDTTTYANEKYHVRDIHYGNVVEDNNGNMVVIDANPKYNEQYKKNVYGEDGFTLEDVDNGYSEELTTDETPTESTYKQRIKDHINNVTERLGSNNITNVIESIDDISDPERRAYIEQAHKEGRKVYGWFENGQVFLYLPDIDSEYKAEQTIWHETVAHVGLRDLIGADNYGKLLNRLWLEHKDKEMGEWVTQRMQTNGWSLHKAIDEWLAREAEKVVAERQGRRTLWQKLAGWLGDMLRELGYRTNPTLTDVRYLFWLSENQLKDGEPMSAIKRAAFLHRLEMENNVTHWFNGSNRSNDMDAGYSEDIDNPLEQSAKDIYHDRLNRVETVFTEAYQDAMVSLKTAQNAIVGDKNIPDSQNAYMAENLMHGKNKNEQDLFNRMFRDPIINTINKIMDITGMNWGDIDRYVYTKHGLERNRELYVRDWLEKERANEDADIDLLDDIENRWLDAKSAFDTMLFSDYLESLDNFIRNNIDNEYNPSEHDYSGFRAMFGNEDGVYNETDIIADLMNTEGQMEAGNVNELWERINAATKYGLERYREAGMRSDEQIDRIEQMFHWYVPLRGFKEETGEDMYQYFSSKGNQKSYIGGLLKHAKGRGSEANYPISTIFAMSYKAISDCNQNLVNQKLYRLCQAHENDLIVLSDSWAVLNESTGEWEESYPKLTDDMDEEDIRHATLAFEQEMKDLANDGKAKKLNGKQQFDYVPMDKKKKSEHVVEVRINGQQKRMTIVGNPRMAQALNGQLRFERGKNIFSKWNAYIKNKMASLFTSYSPTFALRNMFRDWTHFRTMLSVREGERYAKAANKYYRQSLFKMVVMFKKYRNGTLDMSNEMERDFKEFMDNGGITGFTQMSKVDDIQKEMEKLYAQQKQGKPIRLNNKLWEKILDAVEALNEGIENNARFATYRASRHVGSRTRARSAYDAKEITVNFNRKGAGSKTYGFKSQNKRVEDAAKAFGVTSQVLGEGRIFFNATVQAIATTFKNFQHEDGSLNKSYIAKWTAKYAIPPFLFGLALPMINKALASAFGGDDDDPYANLPEWTRRKNLCFYIGNNNFITIPIGQELSAFLSLGDMAAGMTYYPELKPLDKSFDDEIVGIMNTFSPVDVDTKITKGGMMENPISEVAGRTFSVLAPLVAVENNLSWTGRPIYREDRFQNDQYTPEYQMVYSGTNPVLVNASKLLHELGGGDDVTRGKLEVNPAIVQYLWEQYTGGPGKVFSNTISIGKDAKDLLSGSETEFNIRKVEGLKAFVQQGDDRTAYYRTQAKYRKYSEDAEKLYHDVKGYENGASENPMYLLKLEEITKGDEFVRMQIIREADKQLSEINKAANKAEGRERKELRQLYNQSVKEVVDLLDSVGK